jgi:hypothetical protein
VNRRERRQAERIRARWLAAVAKDPEVTPDFLKVAAAVAEHIDHTGAITDPEINAAIAAAGGRRG